MEGIYALLVIHFRDTHLLSPLYLPLDDDHFALFIVRREQSELVVENLLGGKDLLVVHFLQEAVILDSVGFEEFAVSHLKGLADRSRDVLSLFAFEYVTDLELIDLLIIDLLISLTSRKSCRFVVARRQCQRPLGLLS